MSAELGPGNDAGRRPGFVVKRAEEAEWAQVKAVRLSALTEAPEAFGSTLAEESGYEERDWRDWCRDTATFLAFHQQIPVGIAVGLREPSPKVRKVIAMWVDPQYRRTGTSTALLTAVQDWAVRDGADTLMLWVTRGNHAAASLYRQAGFSETGNCKPLPSNPALIEDQLTLHLEPSRGSSW